MGIEDRFGDKKRGAKKGVPATNYKEAKKKAFVLWLEAPGIAVTEITRKLGSLGYEVNSKTVSKWVNDEEWDMWHNKAMKASFKNLGIDLVKLHKKAIDFCDRSLDGRLDEHEAKFASTNAKIVSMILDHSGMINKKPFLQVNNNLTQINNNNLTDEMLDTMTQEQLNNYLFRQELPEIDHQKELEEGDIIIPEEDIIRIVNK